ncbi:MAG: DNA polymerase III subunit beta [Tepidanaerobacteraceae bacterium]|nr:DNA polymerase III subunit beta [Tepidanaerobacteraceae bacterium]
MKFFIDRDILISSLYLVEKFVPSKSPLALLSGIRFFASGDSLSLSATDLDMGIEHKVFMKDVEEYSLKIIEEGSCVIPVKIFSEIIRKSPSGEVSFSVSDSHVEISAKNFKMNLPCYDAQDFPEITREELLPTMNFSQKLFKNMIKQTAYARADESTSRPQFTGILLERRRDALNMVALDGFRIAWRKENLDENPIEEGKDFSFIIPGKTLLEIFRIFGDTEERFDLYAGKNRVEFRSNNTVISSRLLDGSFIDYEQVTRVEAKTEVHIDAESIFSAIDRGLIMAREGSKNNLVKFKISSDVFEVSADTEMGSLVDRLPCKTKGDDLVIAFNARFVMDALRSVETPEVKLLFSGESGPCIIEPVGMDNQVNLVLPVRLRGEDY